MAITVDVTSIGSSAIDASSSTISFNTSSTVASNAFIVLTVSWFNAVTISSVSGGGLTWAVDKSAAAGSDNSALVSAQAPSGLASGTTITVNLSGAAFARGIGGISFLGVATSSALDGTPPAVHAESATTAWTTNSQTLTAGSVMVSCSHTSTNNTTSTTTGPATEINDINGGAGTFSATAGYLIQAAGGSTAIAGTWGAASTGCTNGAAYLQASGAAAVDAIEPRRDFEPVRFGPF